MDFKLIPTPLLDFHVGLNLGETAPIINQQNIKEMHFTARKSVVIQSFARFRANIDNLRSHRISIINPIQTGEGLLRPAPILKVCNFMTIKTITTKLGEFSYKSSGNIFTFASRDQLL